MKALILIDVQNEFTENGKRKVENIEQALQAIHKKVETFRELKFPIVWIQHFNKPTESKAFMPGTWGVELINGFGPSKESENEVLFQKNVYGAFTGTPVGKHLQELGINEIEIAGFATHGCVSTTTREAIMAGVTVHLDIDATSTYAMNNKTLGSFSADEMKRAALIQVAEMGANVY